MANEEHVAILKTGTKAWNDWRESAPGITPDLSGRDLREANLKGMNFTGTTLGRADLSGANLRRADLTWANLCLTDLSHADLSGAFLLGTDLTWANLNGANLSDSILRGAYLHEANMTNSQMSYTIVGEVDLSQVKGLETVGHGGPSTIGIETIYRSHGRIPETFLRGAGVPEVFITNMRSLVAAMSPIEFYSCFISYSSNDQEFAERLYADLQATGVRCWYALEDLKIGDKFRQRIDDAILLHDKLLVVLSESSVRSIWVESEVEAAFERESQQAGQLVLFPIRLDDAVMDAKEAWAADIRRKCHIGDFTAWQDHNSYKKAFDRLLRDLQGKTEAAASE